MGSRKSKAVDPDDIKRMTDAYERALIVLGVTDRNDPFTEIVAQEIIYTGRSPD